VATEEVERLMLLLEPLALAAVAVLSLTCLAGDQHKAQAVLAEADLL
jgi:hypothetical protein